MKISHEENDNEEILLVDDKFGITEDKNKITQKLPKSLEITLIHNKIDLSNSVIISQVSLSGESSRITHSHFP